MNESDILFESMRAKLHTLPVGKYKRYDTICSLVHEMFATDSSTAQDVWIHLLETSHIASLLAVKRGNDVEIAAIIGLLHHFYFFKTGIKDFPGPNSADAVRPILRNLQMFSTKELMIILRSIFYQEDKHQIQNSYEELMKDTLRLQAERSRLQNSFAKLGNTSEVMEANSYNHTETDYQSTEDKRSHLADYAESLARQGIVGVSEDEGYREICKYWPDSDIYKVLESNWCAAFVYHCCMEIGIRLPIRYPNCTYRLAGVGAWLDWAQLPEKGFFYQDQQERFEPQRGDVVVYEKLLSDTPHDHIGIVLSCEQDDLVVAEGNVDNKNYSGVVHRKRDHCIGGYIRIDNNYQFHFQGEYMPL